MLEEEKQSLTHQTTQDNHQKKKKIKIEVDPISQEEVFHKND